MIASRLDPRRSWPRACSHSSSPSAPSPAMRSASPAPTPFAHCATNKRIRPMWRNYLTVGLRSLLKNRVYALINILGLAIGMAACLMILLFVRYELSYDKWLPGVENVYEFQSWYKSRETGEEDKLQMTPFIA